MAQSQSTRALALARRKALSTAGKAAVKGGSPHRTRAETAPAVAAKPAPAAPVPAPAPARPRARQATPVAAPGNTSRAVALARRRAMSVQGKRADASTDRTATGGPKARKAAAVASAVKAEGGCGCGCKGGEKAAARSAVEPRRDPRPAMAKVGQRRTTAQSNPTRAAALARRKAQSTRGKAGMNGGGVTAAQTARAMNPGLSTRELARELREMRSQRGKSASTQKRGDCSGRRRQRPKDAGEQGPARDQAWKVGISETGRGLPVTGTMVGRSRSVTGDEPSTCRTVTGTEYMGADIFRAFCQAEPAARPAKVATTPTRRGNAVTGNEVGRSTKVTGDEPGTCKNVTGTEYLNPDQVESFCGVRPEPGPAKVSGVQTRRGESVTGSNVGRSPKVTGDEVGANRELTGTQYTQPGAGQAPAKVGVSQTLRRGAVTGTMVGRSRSVTGDEPGSCKIVTGDDYVGQEQYGEFCEATPMPADEKVGVSQTLNRRFVTGTMTGRSSRVTGDEPGTCKAVTGTPYAGVEQYAGFCEPDQTQRAAVRMRRDYRAGGAPMTGQQPSVGGVMTGDARGACETVSGTPYVGADQMAQACPAVAAEPHSPDFPQTLGAQEWGRFSVAPPVHASYDPKKRADVTGTSYEQGQITGPFGKADGKVTGTEEARFGRSVMVGAMSAAKAAEPEQAPRSRVTGEGMEVGQRITGDDWDRGSNVTGTEGASALVRNPTRRGGPMSAMAPLRKNRRNEDIPAPVSRVTGSSGNTDRGSLITYSGGARG